MAKAKEPTMSEIMERAIYYMEMSGMALALKLEDTDASEIEMSTEITNRHSKKKYKVSVKVTLV